MPMTEAMKPQTIVPGIQIHAGFLADADELLTVLRAEVRVRQEHLDFGRGPIPMPRLTGWYGDPGALYAYSGLLNEPNRWTPTLGALRARLAGAFACELNSCLVNVYRDGRKSIGWHADDEPELRGLIVSASLGATRTFRIREGRSGSPLDVPLEHGSVLTMTVASQQRYQHAVPKEPTSGPRMNLTYRYVTPR
jgi:alkylated DNA repair dioxygenase AlkB